MTAKTIVFAQTEPSIPFKSDLTSADLEQLESARFNGQLVRHNLLQFLITIQQQYGWINQDAIIWCSNKLSNTDNPVSREEIRGIIDFYSFLERQPCPGIHLHLSTNVTDYMLGQQENIEFFTELANQHPSKLRVSKTSCSGLCDQGPAGLINGIPVSPINETLRTLIADVASGKESVDKLDAYLGQPKDNIHKTDILLSQSPEPGFALKTALQKTPEQLLTEINVSKLRGRGGAGFPTGFKWQTCKDTESDIKVVVCNADEGEPGTFKDRVLLHSHINQVIDGMTIAAYTVGANKGFIYLRYEYQHLLADIEQNIQARYNNNLLGEHILGQQGFVFDLQIHSGAGAYICGEETALLESLEGKRGVPRVRPPFPAESGYLGYPTIVNNVETFCCISEIALTGGNTFANKECEGSTGTKVHSVSGDCEKPGIYELPFDSSVQDILTLVDAKNVQAVQVGGPSGKLLFPDKFSEKVNFSHVSSGGSFMVFDQSRDLFDIVKNFTDFFHHESCGFCTPCRVGCGVLSDTLERFSKQNATDDEIQHIHEMIELMDVASHCGLGQTATHTTRFLLEAKPELFKNKEVKDSVLKIDIKEITSDARQIREGEAHE